MAKQDVELKFSLIDGVSRSLGEIQKGVTGLGASLVKINAAADLTGKAFGAIKAVGGVFADQITGAGNFEDSLAALQAVTGATAEDFTRLRDAAVDASERTRFSSVEAANGLTELARAGYSASEAISVLNPTLAIAQGNNISVAQSAELLTTTLKQFGASATDAAKFADVLQATADGTATSVEQMGNALSYVAPLARNAGVSIEETSAIIGALADQGFRGERAGTALRNVFGALLDPSSKFAEALDAAGIKSRDFSEIIQILGKDTNKAKDVILALDSEARPAILSLVNSGGAAISKLTKELQDAGGAAERTSAILGATFNASLDRLGNSFENIRNALLTPILQPLATEFQSLSAQLSDFAKTEQFALIVEQFRLFATSAIQYVGDAVRSFDFAKAVDAVGDFAFRTVELFKSVEQSLKTIAGAVNDTANLIKETYQGLADFAEKVEAIYSDFQNGTTDAFNVAGDGIKRFGEESDRVELKLGKLSGSTKKTSDAADTLAKSTGSAGKAADTAGTSLGKMGKAADGAAVSLDNVVRDVGLTAEALGGVPSPAGQTASALESVSASSNLAGQSLNALEKKLSAVREALANAAPGSPEFIQLAQDAAKLEEQIRLAKEAIDEASGANERLRVSSDGAAGSLRNQASAARDAADAGERVAQTNSQVSEEFGNIARQSSSVAISLGNLSEAFVQQALAAAGSSTSADDYVDTWNRFIDQSEVIERALGNRIDLLTRMTAATDEESRIRAQLEQQYGTSSRRLEELVQLELKLAEAKRQRNQEAEREIEIEDRRQQQAGGIGTQNQGQQQAGQATSAGRGGTGSGSRATGDSVVNINITGLTEAGIRDLVPTLERELARSEALRR